MHTREHILKPVGGMSVVNYDGIGRICLDKLHPAGHSAALRERIEHLAEVIPHLNKADRRSH